jgi:hypothetical protein
LKRSDVPVESRCSSVKAPIDVASADTVPRAAEKKKNSTQAKSYLFVQHDSRRNRHLENNNLKHNDWDGVRLAMLGWSRRQIEN